LKDDMTPPMVIGMSTATKPLSSVDGSNDVVGDDASPHVAIAPGVLEHEHIVIRAEDDTDLDYEARVRLVAAALGFAHTG
jgi:hypothetical protein